MNQNNNYNKKTCCFFGHRDTPREILPLLGQEIEKLILYENVSKFYLGGYGNFDYYSADLLNYFKIKYDFIKLIYVTPYLSKLDTNREYINRTYDEAICPDCLKFTSQKSAIPVRNRWIVDNSDFMIAYICRSKGGAYKAFNYGKTKKIKIINLSDYKAY